MYTQHSMLQLQAKNAGVRIQGIFNYDGKRERFCMHARTDESG